MAAGTQAYIVGQEYDPRKITLEDFISMFEKESVEVNASTETKVTNNFFIKKSSLF